jgi:hypothetical protein
MPLFCNKTLRDSNKNLELYLVDEKPNKHVFVFTPSVGVEHFWVDLNVMACFSPIPNVGVGHLWVECT